MRGAEGLPSRIRSSVTVRLTSSTPRTSPICSRFGSAGTQGPSCGGWRRTCARCGRGGVSEPSSPTSHESSILSSQRTRSSSTGSSGCTGSRPVRRPRRISHEWRWRPTSPTFSGGSACRHSSFIARHSAARRSTWRRGSPRRTRSSFGEGARARTPWTSSKHFSPSCAEAWRRRYPTPCLPKCCSRISSARRSVRRVLLSLRRSRTGDRVRSQDRRGRPRARPPGAGGDPHGRVRDRRREDRRDRGARGRVGRGKGDSRRGTRVGHGEGPRRGLRLHVRRPRRA